MGNFVKKDGYIIFFCRDSNLVYIFFMFLYSILLIRNEIYVFKKLIWYILDKYIWFNLIKID